MSKFDEQMSVYTAEMKKLGLKYNEDLLTKVAKGCGPSIYNSDANKVSCSDNSELETVKKNFLMKKHGVAEGKCDAAIKKVCETMGSSNRNKYRAIFYYLLTEDLGLAKNY